MGKKKKKGPPSFEEELTDVVTNEGESVTFTLIITSKPELESIKWYKEGKKLKNSENIVISKDDPTYSLEIVRVSKDDAAIYSCTATNAEGTSTTTASIKLKDGTSTVNNSVVTQDLT